MLYKGIPAQLIHISQINTYSTIDSSDIKWVAFELSSISWNGLGVSVYAYNHAIVHYNGHNIWF